jgi:hypothetical protein
LSAVGAEPNRSHPVPTMADEARAIAQRVLEIEQQFPAGGPFMRVDAPWTERRRGGRLEIVVAEETLRAEDRAVADCLRLRGHCVYYTVSAARLYMNFSVES